MIDAKMTKRITQQHQHRGPRLSTAQRRTRTQWWLLLLALPSLSTTPVNATSRVDEVEVILPAAPRAIPVLPLRPAPAPRFRRKLQGEKDGGDDKDEKENKDKNKGTEAPSFAPSPVPSPEPTTATPTPDPTTHPSAAPTDTMAPSPSPSQIPSAPLPTRAPITMSPTDAYPFDDQSILGYLEIALSVQPRLYDASDIDKGNAPELVEAVKEGIARALCEETDIIVIGSGGASLCEAFVRKLLSVHILSDDGNVSGNVVSNSEDDEESVVRDDHALVFAVDREQDSVSWILWKNLYPVMSIGPDYRVVDEDQSGTTLSPSAAGKYGEYLQDPGDSINSLLFMQTQAQEAVDAHMDELNKLLADVDARVAVVGTAPTAFAGSQYDQPLDPPLLHTLRVVGIVMLCVTLLFAWLLTRAAGARKREREWDQEYKERGRGGLVTEEGLDYMLEVGRHKTAGTSPTHSAGQTAPLSPDAPKSDNASDSTGHGLPLPSQYGMNVNIYSSFHSQATQRTHGAGPTEGQIYSPGDLLVDTANERSIEISSDELVKQLNESDGSAVTGWAEHDFDELPKRVQKAARRLGYTPHMWNNDEEPDLCDKYWHRLTKGQQEAAMILGYTQAKWDGSDSSSSSSGSSE